MIVLLCFKMLHKPGKQYVLWLFGFKCFLDISFSQGKNQIALMSEKVDYQIYVLTKHYNETKLNFKDYRSEYHVRHICSCRK